MLTCLKNIIRRPLVCRPSRTVTVTIRGKDREINLDMFYNDSEIEKNVPRYEPYPMYDFTKELKINDYPKVFNKFFKYLMQPTYIINEAGEASHPECRAHEYYCFNMYRHDFNRMYRSYGTFSFEDQHMYRLGDVAYNINGTISNQSYTHPDNRIYPVFVNKKYWHSRGYTETPEFEQKKLCISCDLLVNKTNRRDYGTPMYNDIQ